MSRTIAKDLKPIKPDLERLVKKSEFLSKDDKNFISGLFFVLGSTGTAINVADSYKKLRQEVYKDDSIADKKKYMAQFIRESMNYFAEELIEMYVK